MAFRVELRDIPRDTFDVSCHRSIYHSVSAKELGVESELVLRVSRDAHNRLSGTVSSTSDRDDLPFSGTLELLRILEDLVPDGTEPDPEHGTAGR